MYLESRKMGSGSQTSGPHVSYGSVTCYELGRTAGIEQLVSKRSFLCAYSCYLCLHYHLSPASCQISGGMVNVMYLNHPKTIFTLSVKKIIFHNLVTGAKKVGDSWCR